jgi:DNA invertase Pin-like site-specific DNA recombinase
VFDGVLDTLPSSMTIGAVAEFENDIRRERQRDGIKQAEERGVDKARPATINAATISYQHAEGTRSAHIARQLGIGRATVHWAFAD